MGLRKRISDAWDGISALHMLLLLLGSGAVGSGLFLLTGEWLWLVIAIGCLVVPVFAIAAVCILYRWAVGNRLWGRNSFRPDEDIR